MRQIPLLKLRIKATYKQIANESIIINAYEHEKHKSISVCKETRPISNYSSCPNVQRNSLMGIALGLVLCPKDASNFVNGYNHRVLFLKAKANIYT